jgi:anti-sigma factor RsiW
MDCDVVRPLIAANVDGEVDLVRRLEIEAHVRDCRACARIEAGARSWQGALRRALPRHAAPPGLADRIARAVGDAPRRLPGDGGSRRARRGPWLHAASLAAAVLMGVLLGRLWGGADERAGAVFAEAVAGHQRSLQAAHLTDVPSSDQHTVKPWFAGKLDFSPPVLDLAAAGFGLVGGRLDRIDGHAAAALVFRRREHVINLFVWPAGGAPLGDRQQSVDGYHARSWSHGGFDCVAVSDVADAELAAFAVAFRTGQ